jgi:hypothetical protein
MDRVDGAVDRRRHRSTVDRGQGLGGGSSEDGRNGAPHAWNLTAVEEEGGGNGGEPHRLQEGAAEGWRRPGVGLNLWSQISCTASGLALLEDEQKFKLRGCVGAHKTSISCANRPSKCIK